MKATIAFLILLLTACTPQYLGYKFQLDEPVPSKPLFFENDSLSIAFSFRTTALDFTLKNKMTDGIKINWDDVSLSLAGKAKRIIHKETGMSKTTDLQPPTTIPPNSSLADILVPSDNVRFVRAGNSYVPEFSSMFPGAVRNKYVNKYLARKGEKIVLFMPLRMADRYVTQTFYFTIVDVYKTKQLQGKKLVWK